MISDVMSALLSSSVIKDMTYLNMTYSRLRLIFDGANKLVLC